jgi:hypothetical protein
MFILRIHGTKQDVLKTKSAYFPCIIYQFYREWFSVCPNKRHNLAPSPYIKASSNKTILKIKLAGVSMIFYYAKLNLSRKRNGP